jgi:phage terminase small subunit
MTKQATPPAISEESTHGPCMAALTAMQRRFVLAMLADPSGTQGDWGRAAGYSDKADGAKVQACRNLQDTKVQAAIYEVARGHLNGAGPLLAIQNLLRIANDPRHSKNFDATVGILDRVGIHTKSEHRVTVEHKDDREMLALVARLAGELGVDARTLIGANAAEGETHRLKLIEATATEIKAEPEPDDPFAAQPGKGEFYRE